MIINPKSTTNISA